MDDLLSEFLTETSESLAVLDVELVKLEQNPNDTELLSSIFRLVHTVKGTCGFLGLPRLESVAHAGENVLGKVRDGELEVTAEAVSLILACLDRIRSIMGDLETTGSEPEGDDSELIKRLNAFADGAGAAKAVPVPAAPAPAKPAATKASGGSIYEQMGGMGTVDAAVEVMFQRIMGDLRLKESFAGESIDHVQGQTRDWLAKLCGGPDSNVADPFVSRGFDEAKNSAIDGHLQAALTTLEVPQNVAATIIERVGATRGGAPAEAAPAAEAPAPAAEAKSAKAAPVKKESTDGDTKESQVANQSIRVNVDLLENLMTMVSELVLTRNQVMQILRKHKDSDFAAPLQRLNHVTSELQEGVMKTRMQPIGNAWAKLPRIIRDLSLELKKKIDLVMIGQDTELDRQVLEMIKDPLTHMVRNSADHGLETPEERRKAGKPETGKVTLNAYHEGGHIVIEITDDGKGLPMAKIKEKILANGLATEAELAQMSTQQIQQFIFKAGFSTAAKVTSVSGRGVGMDVVRTNIERIGGTAELRSIEGKGTTFLIKIPLTLAIVSALVVECAGERFAIPQISVVELVRASKNGELKVERIKDTPVLRLRNKLLPLVSLREKLKLDGGTTNTDDTFVVVTQVGNYQFGIMVDRVFDTEEIVVKPVAPILRYIEVFSGNTILGDGSVIMILDPNGIAAASGQMSLSDAEQAETQAIRSRAHGDEAVPLLLFRAGEGAPKAVPLALISRLEELERSSIERSNDRFVVQYRGQLMPLISMDGGAGPGTESVRQPVLVFADNNRAMGLMVEEIVDIVEAKLNVDLAANIAGRIGSAIIAGQATDIIDTGHYLSQAFGDWFGSSQADSTGDGHKRVLMVDDSAFFRNLLAPQLSAAGFSVTAVDGPDKALALAEAGETFDLIISDIEMPGMNGFEFCAAVKKNEHWATIPIIALSSHASPKELAAGRDVGFDDYVAKYDREGLVHTMNEALAEVRGAA